MSTRIAACDLGKAAASFVIAEVKPDGAIDLDTVDYVLHEGRPFEAFKSWYRDRKVADCAALAATGVYASDLGAPVLNVPEDACQQAALARLDGVADTVTLVSIGARGYSVLTRSPARAGGGSRSAVAL